MAACSIPERPRGHDECWRQTARRSRPTKTRGDRGALELPGRFRTHHVRATGVRLPVHEHSERVPTRSPGDQLRPGRDYACGDQVHIPCPESPEPQADSTEHNGDNAATMTP